MGASLLGFFTLSSAAIVNLALHAGFYGYRVIVRVAGYRTDWRPLAFGVISVFALLQLLTKGGAIATIINYVALDPVTGYFRLAIWEFGSASVWTKPLFGHGYTAYERPAWMVTDSIDNHWLFIAIRYGLPAVIVYLALVLYVVFRLGSISMKLPRDKGDVFGALLIVISCATVLGLTVAFVNEFHVWFIFMLAASTALIQSYDRRIALQDKVVRQIKRAQLAAAE
jgi:O-antigen ligase